MKKLIPLCSLLTALVLLASCGSTGGKATPVPSPTAPSASAAPQETPTGGKAPSGILSEFTTNDLEGNEADQSILAGHTLTMVNVWATFCPPCIDEMPDLAEISEEYAGKGLQVVGLVSDLLNQDGTISAGQVDLAKDIVESTGADYLHLEGNLELYQLFLGQVDAVPTTFFVDENGVQVGYAYQGAREKKDWIAIIDPLLEEMEK